MENVPRSCPVFESCPNFPFFLESVLKSKTADISGQPAVIRVAVLEDADEGDEREVLEDARAAIEEEGQFCEPGAAERGGGGGGEARDPLPIF